MWFRGKEAKRLRIRMRMSERCSVLEHLLGVHGVAYCWDCCMEIIDMAIELFWKEAFELNRRALYSCRINV